MIRTTKAVLTGAAVCLLGSSALAQESGKPLITVIISDIPTLIDQGGELAGELQPGMSGEAVKAQLGLMLGDAELEGLPKGSDAVIQLIDEKPAVFIEVGGGKAEAYATQIKNFGQATAVADGVVIIAPTEGDLNSAKAKAAEVKKAYLDGAKAPSVAVVVDMAAVLEKYSDEVDGAIEQINETMSTNAAGSGATQAIVKVYANLFLSVGKQIETLEVKLDLPGKGVQMTKVIKPKAGTDLAKLANASKPAAKDLLPMLPGEGGMRMSASVNAAAMIDFLDSQSAAVVKGTSVSEEQVKNMLAWGRKAADAWGDNFAQVGMLPGGGIASGITVYDLENRAAAEELIKNMKDDMEKAGILALYESMGMKTTIEVNEKAEEINGAAVYTVLFTIESDDPQMKEAFANMFPDGITYKMALLDKHMLIVMGKEDVAKAIDAVKAGKSPTAKPLVSATSLPAGLGLYVDVHVPSYLEAIAATEQEGAEDMKEFAAKLKGADPLMIGAGAEGGSLTGRMLVPTTLIKKAAEIAKEQAEKQMEDSLNSMDEESTTDSSGEATTEGGEKSAAPTE